MLAGMAGPVNSATFSSENLRDGAFGSVTATGSVINANSATYGSCCSATGDPSSRLAAFSDGDQPSGTLGRAGTATALGGRVDPITVGYGGQTQIFSRA